MQSPPDLAPLPFTQDELDDRLARTSRRGAAIVRRRRLALGALAGMVAGVVALAAVLVAASRPPSAGRAAVAPAAFRLVGVVTPAWHLLGGPLEDTFALACPAADTCYATNQGLGGPGLLAAVEVTTDGGASWTRSALPAPLTFATRLACVDAAHCALVGLTASGRSELLVTADGGATWSAHPGPSGLTSAIGVAALACTSTATCVVVASDPGGADGAAVADTTTDGGATWATAPLPAGFAPLWLACSRSATCVTGGFVRTAGLGSGTPTARVLSTADGGHTWTTTSTPSGLGPLDAGACAPDGTCVATFFDGSRTAVYGSADGGATLTAADATGLPRGAVTSVACPAASACVAVGIGAHGGQGALIFPSGGRPEPPGPMTVWVAGGGHGLAAVSADAGQTWRNAALPSQVVAVLDVSCPSADQCDALAAVAAAPGRSGAIAIELMASTPRSSSAAT